MSTETFYEQVGVAMTCRSYKEYEEMFMLDESLLGKGPILDVAGGASSFSTKANEQGYDAFAVDPLYNLSFEEMMCKGQKEMQEASEKLNKSLSSFSWESYGSLAKHIEIRKHSLDLFLNQYQEKKANKRFVYGALPDLPFNNETFSLVLCNHFLFLYEEQFDFNFHLQAIQELIRVTKKGGEIRIYPLVNFRGERYPYLNKLLDTLSRESLSVKTINTLFRFVPAATEVLIIKKAD
ncbi:class I SAM-dependent methyltransferase [Bacillus sp. 1780r2a1]|uniref:class I SAM-dependent methyltransferase n=1 Tax=Priestia flexa TaxID=86664 RepID=UPI0021FCA91A|nr:class I SAM-dependent methyltransferase [Priestia flexa]MDT2046801.1 class I SAM-dependent methyltransferase [Priestia flexa]USY53207.1 class I SAM-dependent methyltransferase [Bacillus sp. 1780r2a1]